METKKRRLSSSLSLLASPLLHRVSVGDMVRSVFRTGVVVALSNCDVCQCERLFDDAIGCKCQRCDILDTNGNLNENLVGLQTLGRGGFGVVYGGQFGSQLVAVKYFHTQTVNNDAKVASFNAEANCRQLVHPNIVRVLSSNCLNTQNMYIVMELAGLHNLQSLLDDATEPLGVTRHLRYMLDIAEALLFVHQRQLVHLDVKPPNIIITPSDHCKLGDFGCSQYLVDTASDGRAVSPTCRASLTGTYAYRAPELLRGEAPTANADIYSFGVTQWQMMSRQRPYENQHQHCVIFGVVAYNMRPELATDLEQTDMVSSGFRELYRQCWRPDPVERPSAADLVDVFTTWSNAMYDV
ncbi:hypothetical protein NP493_232g00019 [Ridgeia piscesae]|uniref:non-specific serine/threonine protein kinase n=1 Tax=Ridgeia piscesae TaxID=27915 RepID=A0AAD9NZZ5_RIDPI|nr:hypothetical protein NP493_232g00019 [Ridgeia piscesae]